MKILCYNRFQRLTQRSFFLGATSLIVSQTGIPVGTANCCSFGTMTADLLMLSDWRMSCGVTHVAMESTGEYWKPIFNILENNFEVILVNAQHISKVPGRKTDVSDAEWIADR